MTRESRGSREGADLKSAGGEMVSHGIAGEGAALVGSRLWQIRLRGLVLPLALLAGWELATRFHWVNTRILVRPSLVLTRAVVELTESDLLGHLLASVLRDTAGLLLGSTFGIVVGAWMGLSRAVDRLLGKTFHAAKQVAIFAWIPLMSVWLGTGELAKVAFIALAAFYPVVLNTHEGIRSVPREYLEVARVFEFGTWKTIRRVVLPSAAPSMFAGLHLALVYGWLATIGAEYLLEPASGIGNLMIDGREQFAMDKVLLGVVIVGLVGYVLNQLGSVAESRALRWRMQHV